MRAHFVFIVFFGMIQKPIIHFYILKDIMSIKEILMYTLKK